LFQFIPYKRFRDTPSVRFFDVTIPRSNARDLVAHLGPAVSPPDATDSGAWQFYLHPHQDDNLLAASGGRTFYLINLAWEQPFHTVRLEHGGDILTIPRGTFHRSLSDPDGSVVLNQAIRDPGVCIDREFRVYDSSKIPKLSQLTSNIVLPLHRSSLESIAHAA
jgi:hypothetical protein